MFSFFCFVQAWTGGFLLQLSSVWAKDFIFGTELKLALATSSALWLVLRKASCLPDTSPISTHIDTNNFQLETEAGGSTQTQPPS